MRINIFYFILSTSIWILWKFCNSFAVPSNSKFLHNGTSIGLSRQHENRFNAWVSPKSRQRKKGKTQGWLCLLNASHQSASLPRSAGDSPNGRYSTGSFLSVSDKHLRLLELISRLVVDGITNLNSWEIDEEKKSWKKSERSGFYYESTGTV